MHYSDAIVNVLIEKHGFLNFPYPIKEYRVPELAGHLSPEGIRVIYVDKCNRSRYISVCSGFEVIKDIDGRDFEHNPEEGARILAAAADNYYA